MGSISASTNALYTDTFTGNGSTTAFTLSTDPGTENNTRVYIDGIYQSKSNYSVSTTTLTFFTPPWHTRTKTAAI